MKNADEYVKMKCAKNEIDYSSISIDFNFFLIPNEIKEDIQNVADSPVILINYLSEGSYFFLTEKVIGFKLDFELKIIPYEEIKSSRVNLMYEYQEGRVKKEDFSSFELTTLSEEIYYLRTERNGAAFFLSDIITVLSEKSS